MAGIDKENYIRCHVGVQVLSSAAVPCVQDTIEKWHRQMQASLSACTNPSICPSKGKPKSTKGSCWSCVQWGQAIENALYHKYQPSTIPWNNVNPTLLDRDPVEVAKAFVLRLPPGHVYKKIGDFDAASLLTIMMRFKEFHQGDTKCYDLITKLSGIRNSLSHMKIDGKLNIDQGTLTDYFTEIHDLINNLGRLRPLHFTQTVIQNLTTELNEIQFKPITTYMKTEALKPFSKAMEEVVRQTIQDEAHSMRQEWKLIPGAVEQVLSPQLENIAATAKDIPVVIEQSLGRRIETMGAEFGGTSKAVEESVINRVEASSAETQRGLKRVSSEISELGSDIKRRAEEDLRKIAEETKGKLFHPEACKTQLMLEYRENRGKVPLLPGMPEECANIDDIYVDMELIRDQKTSSGENNRQLDSHEELLDLKDDNSMPLNRIIVRGGPGAGKSTTVSKIAFDWATKTDKACFAKYQLMFALDLREIKPDMDLVDAIQDQLLPKVHKDGLSTYLESHARCVVYLLDGYDEAFKTLQHKDIKNVLSCKWLQESLVIVTTRPHKIAEYIRSYGVGTHVQLLPFSFGHIIEYVCRFFQILVYINYVEFQVDKSDEDVMVIASIDNREYFNLGAGDDVKIGDKSESTSNVVYQIQEATKKNGGDSGDEDGEGGDGDGDDDDDHDDADDDDDDDDDDEIESGECDDGDDVTNKNDDDNDSDHKKTEGKADDLTEKGEHEEQDEGGEKSRPDDDEASSDFEDPPDEPPVEFKKTVDDAILLLQQIEESPNIASLSEIPAMLTMICLLWGETHQLPETATSLYQEATLHLAKHKEAKYDKEDLDVDKIKEHLDGILIPIGRVAIKGLFEDRLIFKSCEFDEDVLEESCHLGLLSKERNRSKLRTVQHIMFLHKTFQEMCAGIYFGHLKDLDKKSFDEYLRKITLANIDDMALFLRFCCGVSSKTSSIVLDHVVKLSEITLSRLGERARLGDEISQKDPWKLALLMHLESDSHVLSKYLMPLFQNPDINIFLDRNLEKLSAIEYFLESEIDVAERPNVLNPIHKACVSVKSNTQNILHKSCSKVIVRIFSKLLACLTQIQTLVLDTMYMDDFSVLSAEDIKLLAAGFRKLKCLTSLDIDGDGNVDALIKAFCSGMTSTMKDKLNSLTVNCTFTVQSMVNFVSQLSSLRYLSLTGPSISQKETEQILCGVTSGKLEELALNDCEVSAASLKHHIPHLQVLILVCGSRKRLCEAEQLFATFSEVGRNLENGCSTSDVVKPTQQVLCLPCTQLTLISIELPIEAVRSLTESFAFLSRLQYLRLTNAGLDDKCVNLIAKSLHFLPNLLQIDLEGNRVGPAAKVLADNLQHVKKLTILNLAYTDLGEEEVSAISKSLCHVHELQELSLSENKCENGGKDLANNFRKVPNLKELRLTDSYMSEDAKQQMCCSMGQLTSIEKLDLSHNPGFTMSELCKGIQCLKSLKELELDECGLTDEFFTSFQWSNMSKLSSLSLYGENQLYGPVGVEHLFRNLHHMQHLETLVIIYKQIWHEASVFFNECWHACSLDTNDLLTDEMVPNVHEQNNLSMSFEKIQSVTKFVREYDQEHQ